MLRLLVLIFIPWARSQTTDLKQRVDLDDVQIKGEAQNKGMSVLNRTKNNLEDRIPLRKDYRTEIIQELPAGFSSTQDKDSE